MCIKPFSSRAPFSAEKKSKPAKRKKRDEEGEGWGFPRIVVNPEIITGVLMMLGAAAWFFAGLAANRIFLYPPILFILGIGAVIRGFTRGD